MFGPAEGRMGDSVGPDDEPRVAGTRDPAEPAGTSRPFPSRERTEREGDRGPELPFQELSRLEDRPSVSPIPVREVADRKLALDLDPNLPRRSVSGRVEEFVDPEVRADGVKVGEFEGHRPERSGGFPPQREPRGILEGHVLQILRSQAEPTHHPSRRSSLAIQFKPREEAHDRGAVTAAPVDLPKCGPALRFGRKEDLRVALHLLQARAEGGVGDRPTFRELPQGALTDRLSNLRHLLGRGEQVVERDTGFALGRREVGYLGKGPLRAELAATHRFDEVLDRDGSFRE